MTEACPRCGHSAGAHWGEHDRTRVNVTTACVGCLGVRDPRPCDWRADYVRALPKKEKP